MRDDVVGFPPTTADTRVPVHTRLWPQKSKMHGFQISEFRLITTLHPAAGENVYVLTSQYPTLFVGKVKLRTYIDRSAKITGGW